MTVPIVANVTLDTSCVMSLLRLTGDTTPAHEYTSLEQLRQWNEIKAIEIWISEKSRTESEMNLERSKTQDPTNFVRMDKWLRTIMTLKSYPTVSGIWVLGISKLGVDTHLESDTNKQKFEDLSLLLFGRKPTDIKEGDLFDLAILFEHYLQNNDLFVTRDAENKMIRLKSILQSQWSITVCTPTEAAQIVKRAYNVK